MRITSQIVADQIAAYLTGRLTLEKLVDWAEKQVMDGDFRSKSVRNTVARLGAADVRAFGLMWEDCQQILGKLGFAARVQIAAAK